METTPHAARTRSGPGCGAPRGALRADVGTGHATTGTSDTRKRSLHPGDPATADADAPGGRAAQRKRKAGGPRQSRRARREAARPLPVTGGPAAQERGLLTQATS